MSATSLKAVEILEKLQSGQALTLDDIDEINENMDLQQEFIVDDLMIKNGKFFVYGKPKRGKSNLALYISLLLSEGRDVFGKISCSQSVLYITTEQSEVALSTRISLMRKSLDIRGDFKIKYLQAKERNVDTLNTLVALYTPDFLVIDCLYNLVGSVNDQKLIMPWLQDFDSMLEKYRNMSLLIVHHQRKGSTTQPGIKQDVTDELMGSQFLSMWANMIVSVVRKDNSKKDVVELGFECRDSKMGMEDMTIKWDRDTCTFDILKGEEIEKLDPKIIQRNNIVKWLKDNQYNYKKTTELIECAKSIFGNQKGNTSDRFFWTCWQEVKSQEYAENYKKNHQEVLINEF